MDLPLKGCVKVVTPAQRFIIVRGFYNIGPTIFQCGVFGWEISMQFCHVPFPVANPKLIEFSCGNFVFYCFEVLSADFRQRILNSFKDSYAPATEKCPKISKIKCISTVYRFLLTKSKLFELSSGSLVCYSQRVAGSSFAPAFSEYLQLF